MKKKRGIKHRIEGWTTAKKQKEEKTAHCTLHTALPANRVWVKFIVKLLGCSSGSWYWDNSMSLM